MAPTGKRRPLLAGALVASICERTSCSGRPTAAVGSESPLHLHGANDDARIGRSMESVASKIRPSPHFRDAPSPDDVFKTRHGRRKDRARGRPQRGAANRQRGGRDRLRGRSRRRRRRTTNNNLRDLVVGGSAAPPGRFPYVVSLQLEKVLDDASAGDNGVTDVHTCGGTLIAMDVVLTAGHCGYEEVPSPAVASAQGSVNSEGHVNFGEMPNQIFYGADVGAYNLTSNEGGGYSVDNMLFEKLVVHPEYTGFHGKGSNGMSLQHDVMLVKLYGASDQPVVRLHDPSLDSWPHRNPVDGEDLVVTGWGDTDPASGGDESTSLASVLHAATVHFVPNDVCEKSKGYSSIQSSTSKFEDYFEYDGTISDDMMCALGESSQDACQGDSGGGLLRLGDDASGDRDVQMGIVSWGLQCGDEDFPGVYSRVGEHYDWIAQNVCELSDSPPSYFNCPTKPYPPGSPYDPVVDLTLTIRFDDFRSETAWLIESIPDFRNIAYRPFGTYKDKTSVDEDNSMSETVPVHSGRFYMLSILDEFADGFCCTVGEGSFRLDSAAEKYPIIDRTLGILWSPHALRRAFYVSPPNNPDPPDYVTVVVTLGIGADPGKFLLVALENIMYEAMLMYEIQPFVIINDSRAGSGTTTVYTRMFRVPVFGLDFERQRYNVMLYDDNDVQASFEVYHGDARPGNLLIAQSGNYGEKNHVSRSFVLFKEMQSKETPSDSPAYIMPVGPDLKSEAAFNSVISSTRFIVCLMSALLLGL